MIIFLNLQDDIFTHANGIILKLRKQIEQITIEKDEEINRLREEMKKQSGSSFSPMYNSSALNISMNMSQPINFPTNESSFNDAIDKNRNAMKRIHFLKQKLR